MLSACIITALLLLDVLILSQECPWWRAFPPFNSFVPQQSPPTDSFTIFVTHITHWVHVFNTQSFPITDMQLCKMPLYNPNTSYTSGSTLTPKRWQLLFQHLSLKGKTLLLFPTMIFALFHEKLTQMSVFLCITPVTTVKKKSSCTPNPSLTTFCMLCPHIQHSLHPWGTSDHVAAWRIINFPPLWGNDSSVGLRYVE